MGFRVAWTWRPACRSEPTHCRVVGAGIAAIRRALRHACRHQLRGFGSKKLLLSSTRFAVGYRPRPHGLGFWLGCRLRLIGLLNVRIIQGQAFLWMVAGRYMSSAALAARHCRSGCESQCNPDNYVTAHVPSILIVPYVFILADACERMGQ